jgi:hypothetical protein
MTSKAVLTEKGQGAFRKFCAGGILLRGNIFVSVDASQHAEPNANDQP